MSSSRCGPQLRAQGIATVTVLWAESPLVTFSGLCLWQGVRCGTMLEAQTWGIPFAVIIIPRAPSSPLLHTEPGGLATQ